MDPGNPFATSLSDAAMAVARLQNLREDVARFARQIGIPPAEPYLVLIEARQMIDRLRSLAEPAPKEPPF